MESRNQNPLIPKPTEDPRLIPLYKSDAIESFALSRDTLVLKISSFEPGSRLSIFQDSHFTAENNTDFLNVLVNTILLADNFQVPYLILDLRGNGGGDICLGYQVIDALMEEENP